MTKLLATIESADALIFARDFILQLHTKGGTIASPFTAPESCHFVRNGLRIALQTADGRMWLADHFGSPL